MAPRCGAAGGSARALAACATLALLAHAAHALPPLPLDEGPDAPDLVEVAPRNFASIVDGRRVAVVAFVHPFLPASGALHPILHQLNQHYVAAGGAEGGGGVLVAYADVHRHRDFVRRFAFKSIPSILVFSRGPNVDLAPSSITYAANKTEHDYRREIDVLVHSGNGLASVARAVVERVQPLLAAATERDEAERRALAAGGPAPNATAEAAVAADGAGGGGAGAGEAAPEHPLKARTRALLEAAELEIEAQLAMVEVSRRKLVFVRDTLRAVEASGMGALAHAMNSARATLLTQASSTPLDVELVAASAADRNALAANIAVLTDLFATAGA
jgi:hypothetical protein